MTTVEDNQNLPCARSVGESNHFLHRDPPVIYGGIFGTKKSTSLRQVSVAREVEEHIAIIVKKIVQALAEASSGDSVTIKSSVWPDMAIEILAILRAFVPGQDSPEAFRIRNTRTKIRKLRIGVYAN